MKNFREIFESKGTYKVDDKIEFDDGTASGSDKWIVKATISKIDKKGLWINKDGQKGQSYYPFEDMKNLKIQGK